MNYRDMLLQDYFDESYDDYFNENKQSDALRDYRNSRKKNGIMPSELGINLLGDPVNGDEWTRWTLSDAGKRAARYLGKTPDKLTRRDYMFLQNEVAKENRLEDEFINSKKYKNLAPDKLAEINRQEQRRKNNEAAGINFENIMTKNPKLKKQFEDNLRALVRDNYGKDALKKHPLEYYVSPSIRKEAEEDMKKSSAYKDAANRLRSEHSEDEKFRRVANRVGAQDASNNVPPAPIEKVSKIKQAKNWAGGHKRQLAIGGAAAASAAGAGVTASGVKNIADLKNITKAKAAWKASGSNLPFEQWRKKQLTKAGIKTGIGGALTALGAGGAVYAAKTKKLNEAEDLMDQYELVELEEAYLEGYYGQLIAEECGFDSEEEMIYYNESLYEDDYDDYDDYYDEDYMLPYFG